MAKHHIKIENIWSIGNNEYMLYIEDKETASLLELIYNLSPVSFYFDGDECVGYQYKCNSKLAKRFAHINKINIEDGVLPELKKKDRIVKGEPEDFMNLEDEE